MTPVNEATGAPALAATSIWESDDKLVMKLML